MSIPIDPEYGIPVDEVEVALAMADPEHIVSKFSLFDPELSPGTISIMDAITPRFSTEDIEDYVYYYAHPVGMTPFNWYPEPVWLHCSRWYSPLRFFSE